MTQPEYYRACENMKRHGGSFAAAIGDAGILADKDNAEKLLKAFPELFLKYSKSIWD